MENADKSRLGVRLTPFLYPDVQNHALKLPAGSLPTSARKRFDSPVLTIGDMAERACSLARRGSRDVFHRSSLGHRRQPLKERHGSYTMVRHEFDSRSLTPMPISRAALGETCEPDDREGGEKRQRNEVETSGQAGPWGSPRWLVGERVARCLGVQAGGRRRRQPPRASAPLPARRRRQPALTRAGSR
jgi:hypothetical protein